MKKIIPLLIFILVASSLAAQNLSAYIDYKNYFFVYNDGPNVEMEYQPVKSYKVGGNSVAYVNGTDNFKVFFNGITYNLMDVPPIEYWATRNLVVYYKNRILSVFDNGKTNNISYYTDSYAAGDSIVGFFDLNSSTLKVYYNGQIQEIETMVGLSSYSNFKVGANILAYQNYNGHFKICYHSKTFDMESTAPISYKVGCSVVAYVDTYTESFKVFYDGNTYTLENIRPTSYYTANNMVAYVDNTGSFKIFYQGQTFLVNSFEPSFYYAKDNIVDFYDGRYFSAFYKGKVTKLESYVPEKIQIDYNHLAYMDRSGYLKSLYNGDLKQISKEKITSFELTGNVLKFNSGFTDVLFFCNGKQVFH